MATDDRLAQQVTGGTASPTPRYQQQVPFREDWAEFPEMFQPIMQNPQDWILHAPQPEVTQPPHHNEPTGIRGLTPGRWFQFENVNSGQTITIPRPPGNTGGRSDQPDFGGGPVPPTPPPLTNPPTLPPVNAPQVQTRTPEDALAEQVSGVVIGPYAGGGTLTMEQFLRAMGSTGMQSQSQTGVIEGPTVSQGGNTVRSGNVSGSNTANVISRSSGGASASGSASQSGSARSGSATSGQSVFIRR